MDCACGGGWGGGAPKTQFKVEIEFKLNSPKTVEVIDNFKNLSCSISLTASHIGESQVVLRRPKGSLPAIFSQPTSDLM